MIRALTSLMLLVVGQAAAHDHYGEWRTFSGGSCCDQKDCRPVPHEIRADGLWLFVNGAWWRANQSEAREQQPVDDQAHACVYPTAAKPHCFARPWTGT